MSNNQGHFAPSDPTSHHHLPPPPPPPDMPPLPPGPPPSSGTYRFGTDSWRPRGSDQNASQQNEFSFRNNNEHAPQYPHEIDQYRPTRSRQYATNERDQARVVDYNGSEQNIQQRPGGYRGNRPNRGRGNRIFHATADRPLLRLKRGTTPDQMSGMTADQDGVKRFLPAEDLSDSAEENMDESESDQDRVNTEGLETGNVAASTDDVNFLRGLLEPPTKRRALGSTSHDSKDNKNVPKWSNPDPYTVLPPLDEAQRKRKDFVKIIRKARIASEKEPSNENQVTANDDFISFGFGEETIVEQDDSDPNDSLRKNGKGVPGAPLGPRQFSHLHNLHSQDTNGAPGTNAINVSADQLGPPPGLEAALPNVFENPIVDKGDASLGNRKRTYDDTIKGQMLRPARSKKAFGRPGGSLLQEWVPRAVDPVPWLSHSNNQAEHPGLRLHKEICDFFNFVKPQEFERIVREELLCRLEVLVHKHFPNCELRCFGSFAAGLYLPNADMDVVVNSHQYLSSGYKTVCQSHKGLYKFAHFLTQAGMAEDGSIEVIAKAKVPLIKFVDLTTNLRVDMSFENTTGPVANDTFIGWKKQFPAMPILVTIIKQFLMMRGLNEVMNGGLGGFSVTCLVVSLLQNMPRIQMGELIPEYHLGEILMEFLDFYGNRLDAVRTGITLDPPGYFDKNRVRSQTYRANKEDRLAIIDPNQPENDVSGGSSNVLLIFDQFAKVHTEIRKAMMTHNRSSLLERMLGGDYSSFIWQRNHLRDLYKMMGGSLNHETTDLRNSARNLDRDPQLTGVWNDSEPIDSIQDASLVDTSRFTQERPSSSFLTASTFSSSNNPLQTLKPPISKAPKLTTPKITVQSRPVVSPKSKRRQVVKVRNTKNRQRAEALKRSHPGIENIPHSISKAAQRKLLIAHDKTQNGNAKVAPMKSNQKKKESKERRSAAFVALLEQPQKPPKSKTKDSPMRPVSEARLADVARHLGGASNDNPIMIE